MQQPLSSSLRTHLFSRVVSVLFSLSLAMPALAQTQTESLTLNAALTRALENNRELAAASQEIGALDGALRQAGVIPNPELATQIEDRQASTRTTTLQLNQPIELGGKRSARMTVAHRNRDLAITALVIKRADIRAATTTAFYDVLIAQEREQLAYYAAELAQQASTAAAKRVTAGKISPIDETKAKLAESGVRMELMQAKSELSNARQRLSALIGGALKVEKVSGDIHTLSALSALPTLPELTAKLAQSPQLLRAKIEVEQRTALTQLERTRQIPDITVSVGGKRDAQLGRNQAIVGVSIPLPIFDRNQGNLQEALHRTDKARDELALTETRLTSELAQAYEQFTTAQQEIALLQRDIVPSAQSVVEATTKGFEYGKFDFLNVLDAMRTLLQAQSQLLRAYANAHHAAAEIERILGSSSAQ
jgi:outer membrane protein, heavy metal efflux system